MIPLDTVTSPAVRIIHWLASGDTGVSSQNIAFECLGETLRIKSSTPLDPDDLGRCLRLISKVPECRAAVDSLGGKYEKWAIAAKHWDELAMMMEEEVGIDWSKGRSAPKTYARMLEIGL